ncbi:MAG: bifunctional riboflavin kinase/FMN adenylyltransferase [Verrucomicrobia bacterium]|nr:bifunctional riboflavin kinase/FMN adenylyltransferase [Verrucomicrobiota bacterium]
MSAKLTSVWKEPEKARAGPFHVAIGIFDGVHLGHRAVIDSALVETSRDGGVCGVFTFTPHPSEVLRPHAATRLIMSADQKTARLFALGVDVVLWQKFDLEMAALSAESFLNYLKTALPGLKTIHVGANFRFGKDRAGDIATLVASGVSAGINVFSVDRLHLNGEAISSSRIRACLESGDIGTVNTLLGYNYSVEGIIRPGKKLGRTLGFPTLNIPWCPSLQPAYGVYCVRVSWLNATQVVSRPS